LIKNSFKTVVYYSRDVDLWEKEYERFKNVIIR